ncbi:MAG: hypothetical protein C0425_00800 [Chlorobiaceae bacterium]|nr:hypothetical protein [Chlorobiaceae bacterium]MBA4308860.1 hypothetical protein [Chlorobiaceae bacterium]
MKKLIVFSIVFIFSAMLYAQGGGSVGSTTATSSAMGNTYTATSFGLNAIGKNPANIFLATSTVELMTVFPLPAMNFIGGSGFFTVDEYNYFFGGVVDASGNNVSRLLNEQDKLRFKSLFENGRDIFVDLSTQHFAILIKPSENFGAVAFSINDMISASANFPNQLIDLAFWGNQLDKVYSFDDTEAKAWWLRKYTLSYSRDLTKNLPIIEYLQRLSAGVSFNFVRGYMYSSLENIRSQFVSNSTAYIDAQVAYRGVAAVSPDFGFEYDFDRKGNDKSFSSPFPEAAGSGFSVDFGIAGKINEKFSFGLSFTDLGSFSWNNNVAEYTAQTSFKFNNDDLTNSERRDSVIDKMEDDIKGVGKYIGEVEMDLPSAMHLGFGVQVDKLFTGSFPGELLFGIDYHQGFNNQLRNSKVGRLSFGFDWSITKVVGLRTGFSFGGAQQTGWGLGLGFDFSLLEINFASSNFQTLTSPNSSNKISFSVDSRWRF